MCSIFAATALVENLYIKAGLPSPDFSEQYMQWAVKNQLHSFPHTEGSSAQSNLQMVVPWADLVLIFVVVYAVALLATLAPAIRASRVPPAEALRYE